jgi:hypothetical protein
MDLFERIERRDPAEILPAALPPPIDYESHRAFVRQTLANEVGMQSIGTQFVNPSEGSAASIAYRDQMNSRGSPTETVALGYRWAPGGELAAKRDVGAPPRREVRLA